jgi:hypothetical protein
MAALTQHCGKLVGQQKAELPHRTGAEASQVVATTVGVGPAAVQRPLLSKGCRFRCFLARLAFSFLETPGSLALVRWQIRRGSLLLRFLL